MAHTILDNVSLGYQLLWNALRQVGGVQLFIGTEDTGAVDAPHLLSALDEAWSTQAPQLLLAVTSPRLLGGLLEHARPDGPWIEVQDAVLRDPAMAQRVHQAHQRGLTLIWRGEPATRPSAALAACFSRTMVTLSAEEALTGLRVSLRKHNNENTTAASLMNSPVVAGHLYEGVASQVLAEHCLDEQGAWGLAGWPMEDVLHGYRHQRIQPGQRAIVGLVEAIDADASAERIEQILSEEPVLAYRYLRYTNSVGLGLRTEIDSLRLGLRVLGLSKFRVWLLEQLPHATSDLNLQPVRTALVVRARLMAHLLDAGEGDDLRREVYLCGLLSQMDLMLGEPMTATLARIPLPERITAAILNRSGPYMPYLDIATALESSHTQTTGALCELHQMEREQVNRALLSTLAHARLRPVKGLLLA